MTAHHQSRRAAFVQPHALAICRIQPGDAPVTAAHHHDTISNLRNIQHFAGHFAFPTQLALFVISQHIALVAADEHQSFAAAHPAADGNAALDTPHPLAGGAIDASQHTLAGHAIDRVFGQRGLQQIRARIADIAMPAHFEPGGFGKFHQFGRFHLAALASPVRRGVGRTAAQREQCQQKAY